MTQSDRSAVRNARRTSSRSDWREDYMTPSTPPLTRLQEKNAQPPSAKKQRAFHSAKDYEMSASQLGDVIPPPPDERRKAALMVAANVPPEEIEDVLMMLGIHPSQPDFDDGPQSPILKPIHG